MTAPLFRHCTLCRNRGLLRVQYHSGEVFDLAICQCAAGEAWRHQGEAVIRERMQLTTEQQVGWLEDFEIDEAQQTPAAGESFMAAGQTGTRAKL